MYHDMTATTHLKSHGDEETWSVFKEGERETAAGDYIAFIAPAPIS